LKFRSLKQNKIKKDTIIQYEPIYIELMNEVTHNLIDTFTRLSKTKEYVQKYKKLSIENEILRRELNFEKIKTDEIK
jgi:hypothetical protein